jgi:hypothetical protein
VKIEMENNVRCTIRDIEGVAILLWAVFFCVISVCVTVREREKFREVRQTKAVGIYRITDRENLAKLKLGF